MNGRDRIQGGSILPVEQQPPEVLALVIADHVHQDDSTAKFFVLGTRTSIGAAAFPFTAPAGLRRAGETLPPVLANAYGSGTQRSCSPDFFGVLASWRVGRHFRPRALWAVFATTKTRVTT